MSRKLLVHLFFCLSFVSFVQAADVEVILQQGSKEYAGTQDVTISADDRLSKLNMGGAHQIDIWQFDGVSLVRFDLGSIPKNTIVKQVSLELFCAEVGFSAEEKARDWSVNVFEARHDWKEGTGIANQKPRKDGATLKTFDGVSPWPNDKVTSTAGDLLGTTIIKGDGHRWYRWDLKTDVIQQWIAGSRVNNGFLIYGKGPGKAVSFTSRDSTAGDRRPILRLTLSLPETELPKLGRLAAADIAWSQFVADCGKNAQQSNEARSEKIFEEKYAGRVVYWPGTVHSVRRKPIGTGYFVDILMEPSESAFGLFDLTLSVSAEHSEKILTLNKGERVHFMGRFRRQGGVILGHDLELVSILPVQPEQSNPSQSKRAPSRKRR